MSDGMQLDLNGKVLEMYSVDVGEVEIGIYEPGELCSRQECTINKSDALFIIDYLNKSLNLSELTEDK